MQCGKPWRRSATLLVGATLLCGSEFVQHFLNGNGPLPAARAGEDPPVAPEFWIFGIQKSPERAIPLGGKGVRGIVDLRTLTANDGITMLEQYAKLGQGFAMTVRWKRPHERGDKQFGKENYDVPPDPVEAANALAVLENILTSDPARELDGKLYVQFYNEVGGGPGKFPIEDLDAMLAFATDAVRMIREKAPHVKVCGPAVTMSQVLNPELEDDPRYRDQATIVRESIKWTAAQADAIDLHMHGRDGTEERVAISTLRELLKDYPGGQGLEIVSWEWSPARFPYRDDDDKVRNAIIGLWQAMAEEGVTHAAYASYWVGEERKKKGVNDIYLWKSIMDENGQRIEPIYSTLEDIGLGRVVLDPPPGDDGGDDGQGDDDPIDEQRFADCNTALWINGVPGSPEHAAQLGAAGVRDVIDLRTASNSELRAAIKAFSSTDMGVAITVRWSDASDPQRFDRAPDIRDLSQMKTKLRNALKSKQAEQVSENDLWLQFFDEVAGDHGRIRAADADLLFDFATDMVDIVRANAPYVSICGPALSYTELLDKSDLTPDEQQRRDMIVRAIDWSIDHADAVDVRAGADESIDTVVQRVRSYLDGQPGGSSLDIVCWKWNGLCAEPGVRQGMDREAIREAMATAFSSMSAGDLEVAAYGPLHADLQSHDLSDQHALLDPFGYKQPAAGESYTDLAEVIGQYAADDGDDQHESDSERRKRMNAFKKEYKNIYKEHFRSSGDPDWKNQWKDFWKSTWEHAWEQREEQGG